MIIGGLIEILRYFAAIVLFISAIASGLWGLFCLVDGLASSTSKKEFFIMLGTGLGSWLACAALVYSTTFLIPIK